MSANIVSPNIVSPNIVSPNIVSPNIVTHKQKTTLNPAYPCDDCGRPAMVKEDGFLSCPKCWVKRHGEQKKELDYLNLYA
tara:strand:- start:578 stop:817 length:240 start_codon:yes stop_codon:yes gene_type:complete